MNRYDNNNKEKKRSVSVSAVVRLVIWAVVLCVLVALFTLGMLGDSDTVLGGINLGGFRYDDSGYSVGNGTVSERVTDITVDWIEGSVTVIPWDGEEISISEDYMGDDDDMALRWRIRDGELTVKYCAPVRILKRTADKNLTLKIPAAMLEGLKEVEIDGTDCDVTFEGNVDELSVDTVDGELDIRGNIGEMELDAVDGNVTFKGAVRKANLDCVDAAVVMYLDMADELNFDQVDGDVTLYLSEDITGFRAEMETVGGGIVLEGFENEASNGRKHARWGDGSLLIQVDGVDCHLHIKKARG